MSQEFSTTIEVRFADLDLYGHVNNVTFFTYLETARVKLFEGFFNKATADGILLVVARAECDYRLPILLDDPVIVAARVEKLGTSSFELGYRLHDGADRTFAMAKTTLVLVSATTGKVVPMPEWVRREFGEAVN